MEKGECPPVSTNNLLVLDRRLRNANKLTWGSLQVQTFWIVFAICAVRSFFYGNASMFRKEK